MLLLGSLCCDAPAANISSPPEKGSHNAYGLAGKELYEAHTENLFIWTVLLVTTLLRKLVLISSLLIFPKVSCNFPNFIPGCNPNLQTPAETKHQKLRHQKTKRISFMAEVFND